LNNNTQVEGGLSWALGGDSEALADRKDSAVDTNRKDSAVDTKDSLVDRKKSADSPIQNLLDSASASKSTTASTLPSGQKRIGGNLNIGGSTNASAANAGNSSIENKDTGTCTTDAKNSTASSSASASSSSNTCFSAVPGAPARETNDTSKRPEGWNKLVNPRPPSAAAAENAAEKLNSRKTIKSNMQSQELNTQSQELQREKRETTPTEPLHKGAIMIFVPGWGEINSVVRALEDLERSMFRCVTERMKFERQLEKNKLMGHKESFKIGNVKSLIS
jgi:hypothetical protein